MDILRRAFLLLCCLVLHPLTGAEQVRPESLGYSPDIAVPDLHLVDLLLHSHPDLIVLLASVGHLHVSEIVLSFLES